MLIYLVHDGYFPLILVIAIAVQQSFLVSISAHIKYIAGSREQ